MFGKTFDSQEPQGPEESYATMHHKSIEQEVLRLERVQRAALAPMLGLPTTQPLYELHSFSPEEQKFEVVLRDGRIIAISIPPAVGSVPYRLLNLKRVIERAIIEAFSEGLRNAFVEKARELDQIAKVLEKSPSYKPDGWQELQTACRRVLS